MKTYRYRLYKVVDGNGDVHYEASRKSTFGWHKIGAFIATQYFWRTIPTEFSNEADAIEAIRPDAHRRRAKSYTIESYKDIQA